MGMKSELDAVVRHSRKLGEELLRVAGYQHDAGRKGPRERYVKSGRPPITVGHHRGTVSRSEFDRIKAVLADVE